MQKELQDMTGLFAVVLFISLSFLAVALFLTAKGKYLTTATGLYFITGVIYITPVIKYKPVAVVKYFPLAVKNSATAKKESEINNTTANRPVMSCNSFCIFLFCRWGIQFVSSKNKKGSLNHADYQSEKSYFKRVQSRS